MAYITATYQLTARDRLEQRAEQLALGLTVGSWTELNHLEQQQLASFKGEVVHTEERDGKGYITIRYPEHNVSRDFSAILTTVFGKLSLDGEIKLTELLLPDTFTSDFPGAKFGIEGVRSLIGVEDRPLLMSIFKGIIGRDLSFLRDQLEGQLAGGIDLVKDDEILYDNPLTPTIDRARIGREVIDAHFQRTGKRALYAITLSGPVFTLKDQAKRLIDAGATAFLLNTFTYGLDVLRELASDPEINVPLFNHPAYSGALIASPNHGVAAPVLLGTLPRAAGADLTLFPSPYGNVALPKDVARGIAVEATRLGQTKSIFPVPSAGIHPGLVAQLVRDFGIDSVINAGGGVHGHPQGAAAGVIAFRQALDAALANESLSTAASRHEELRIALDAWGIKS
ncbi:2,3-diketo-5-methylthiopentyl-1-phosphate enolase [Exiguobacterium sp. KKBO11]|uniref:2,3-diketo-5-methylthiopentyl-1-phosphate enolase n=1 Tax=Exiguobacterium sp. KKBO11 TaxID=1805000 RepID=UPI0007D82ADE|nr:2,3-diketo-5-methylthiopentyl-1-phosphate enolase [Exiguobacterium sp. KKBO11]OAI85303.1 2,3-diketo-5-methylthiopentyl-1-phosphate enolase [Exiguobacterium sp. KKBO11]